MNGLEVVRIGENQENKISLFITDANNPLGNCYVLTGLDNDLFLPKGYYSGDGGIPIIFDSGCTHAVTPFKADFVGKLLQ